MCIRDRYKDVCITEDVNWEKITIVGPTQIVGLLECYVTCEAISLHKISNPSNLRVAEYFLVEEQFYLLQINLYISFFLKKKIL